MFRLCKRCRLAEYIEHFPSQADPIIFAPVARIAEGNVILRGVLGAPTSLNWENLKVFDLAPYGSCQFRTLRAKEE